MKFKAAVLNGIGKPLEIEELELGELGPTDVLVRIQASGLCHTDLEVIEGALAYPLPSFAYLIAISKAPWASPRPMAPIANLPLSKVASMIFEPSPRFPKRLDTGTRQSSKNNSDVSEARHISFPCMVFLVKPGVSASTRMVENSF